MVKYTWRETRLHPKPECTQLTKIISVVFLRLVLTRWTQHVTAVVGQQTAVTRELTLKFQRFSNGVWWGTGFLFGLPGPPLPFFQSKHVRFSLQRVKNVLGTIVPFRHSCNNFYGQCRDHENSTVSWPNQKKKNTSQVSQICETQTNFLKIFVPTQIKFFCVFSEFSWNLTETHT